MKWSQALGAGMHLKTEFIFKPIKRTRFSSWAWTNTSLLDFLPSRSRHAYKGEASFRLLCVRTYERAQGDRQAGRQAQCSPFLLCRMNFCLFVISIRAGRKGKTCVICVRRKKTHSMKKKKKKMMMTRVRLRLLDPSFLPYAHNQYLQGGWNTTNNPMNEKHNSEHAAPCNWQQEARSVYVSKVKLLLLFFIP